MVFEMEVNADKLSDAVSVQVRNWRDWPARFSCNVHEDLWPTPGYGYSHHRDRELIANPPDLLAELRDRLLMVREGGGRFFLCPHGMWSVVEPDETLEQVASFNLDTPIPTASPCPHE